MTCHTFHNPCINTANSNCCMLHYQQHFHWAVGLRIAVGFRHTYTEDVEAESLCDRLADQLVWKTVKPNVASELQGPLLLILSFETDRTMSYEFFALQKKRKKKVLLWDPIPMLSSLRAFFTNEVIFLFQLKTPNGQTYKKVLSHHHKPDSSSKGTYLWQGQKTHWGYVKTAKDHFQLGRAKVIIYMEYFFFPVEGFECLHFWMFACNVCWTLHFWL